MMSFLYISVFAHPDSQTDTHTHTHTHTQTHGKTPPKATVICQHDRYASNNSLHCCSQISHADNI